MRERGSYIHPEKQNIREREETKINYLELLKNFIYISGVVILAVYKDCCSRVIKKRKVYI